MRNILLGLFLFWQICAFGQLREDFSDNNISQNPTWTGDSSLFQINSSQQLQSNGPPATGTLLQLATPSQAVIGTTWEFYINLDLATSSGNYADIFLVSDSSRFNGQNNGYFVRIGGTPDEVSLFRKDGAASSVYVINGRDNLLDKTVNNIFKIKVTRDLESNWTLWLDETGTGQTYIEQGRAGDATYQQSTFFGILLRYSAANNQKFIFDDFTIIDETPPTIIDVSLRNSRFLEVQFNEPVSLSSSQQKGNYFVNNGIGTPVSASRDANDAALVHLAFGSDILSGEHTLSVSKVEDLYGNAILSSVSTTFSYTAPVQVNFRDVRLNEIMPDYNPSVDLPEAEFVELYNRSNKAINLNRWRFMDASGVTATLPNFTLNPNDYVILCRMTDTAAFRQYGEVIGLAAFPTLNDSGDEVKLFDINSKLIDKLTYNTTTYRDENKANGGWSLELVNPLTPCGNAENYIASVNLAGGTPGRQNSVYDITPDTQPPVLTKAEVMVQDQIRLSFSESLDSITASNVAAYVISPDLSVAHVKVVGPEYNKVVLTLSGSLEGRQVYTVRVQNLRDCVGNSINPEIAVSVVLPEPAVVGDIIINEVLFNPRSGGVDFVELVNRSSKYIDFKSWQLGNVRTDSTADNKTITAENIVIAPQQYLVLTTQPEVVQKHYPAASKNAFIKMASFPSYPDDAGTVTLLDASKKLLDKFSYNEKMHFKLLDDVNGVSLERISITADSSSRNWHSAASTVGFATPGYQNSQYIEATQPSQLFTIEPKIFSPDGDGDKDFTTINYTTEANGNLTNITIFDAQGREIRRLIKNELLANKGFFQWDGLDERGRKVPVGYYIIFIELFNLQGQVKAYKETVVVGAKF